MTTDPIPSPSDKFMPPANRLDAKKPKKPNFFHLKSAIANPRFRELAPAKTTGVQEGASGKAENTNWLANAYSRALAEFAMTIMIKKAVRQP